MADGHIVAGGGNPIISVEIKKDNIFLKVDKNHWEIKILYYQKNLKKTENERRYERYKDYIRSNS